MANSALSQIASLPTVNYLFGKLSSDQSTNITPYGTHHVMFNVVDSSTGSNISLDTTTPYTSTANVASMGRVTLKAGNTYKCEAGLGFFSSTGNGARLDYMFYNADTNTAFGTTGISVAFYSNSSTNVNAMGYITPIVDTRIEVKITGFDDVGTFYAANSFIRIEQVAQVTLRTFNDNYSSTELDTGRTWIDSKTIYRKVINVGALPGVGGNTSTAHGITNPDIFTKIELLGDGGTVFRSFGTNGTSYFDYYATSTNVIVDCTSGTANWSGYTGYAILEYTKV